MEKDGDLSVPETPSFDYIPIAERVRYSSFLSCFRLLLIVYWLLLVTCWAVYPIRTSYTSDCAGQFLWKREWGLITVLRVLYAKEQQLLFTSYQGGMSGRLRSFSTFCQVLSSNCVSGMHSVGWLRRILMGIRCSSLIISTLNLFIRIVFLVLLCLSVHK